MSNKKIIILFVALVTAGAVMYAAVRTGGVYTQETESIGAGGGTSSGGVYSNQTSMSTISGSSSGGVYSNSTGFAAISAANPPIANDDEFTVAEDSGTTNLDVLADDSILPDVGETLTITAVSAGSDGGTIAIAGGGTSIDYAPATNFTGDETFTYTINDGTVGSDDTATVTVTVTSVNDAPVLDNTGDMTLTAVNEDDTSVTITGATVADIISSAGGDRITDPDSGAVEGIAVVGADRANGSWEYSTDGGTNWSLFGTLSDSSATLLDDAATTRLRFVPNGDFNGSSTVIFRAWDLTSNSFGDTGVDVSTNGNTTAFSAATEVATVTVIPVNDAPVLDNTGTMRLTSISENEASGTNSGTSVSAIIASAGGDRITDVDDSRAAEGIAVTSVDNAIGTWEYSTDTGANWSAFGAVSGNAATLLGEDAANRVRFVPGLNSVGTATISFLAWDQTSGTNGDIGVDVSTNGGTSAYSTATESAQININPATIYVDASATSGEDTGLTWGNAFLALQDALTFASEGHGTIDEIWVANGSYLPGAARADTFQLQNNLGVYGGFASGETMISQRDVSNNRCILSGDVDENGSASGNSYHVVTGTGTDNTAILDGFIVTGGNADGSGSLSRGGGLINDGSNPTLTNLVFKRNQASDKGGAIYNTNSAMPMIDGCTFTDNSASIGGAIAFESNSSCVVTDNVFAGNIATSNGGALACFGSSPHIGNGLFIGNSAVDGGAVYAASSSGPRFVNCTITENHAAGGVGGGIAVNDGPSILEVINTILWANSASTAVTSDVSVFDSESVTFKHCDVAASNGSGASWATALGTDATGNIDSDPKFDGGGATSTSSASATFDSATCATTITDSTGLFTVNALAGKYLNPDTSQIQQFPILSNTATTITFLGDFLAASGAMYLVYDYQLESGLSPCIDSGFGDSSTEFPLVPTTDLSGNARVDHPIFTANTGVGDPMYVDMGVFESQGTEIVISEWAVSATHGAGAGDVSIAMQNGDSTGRACIGCTLRITFSGALAPGTVNTSVLTISGITNGDLSSTISSVSLENSDQTLVIGFSADLPDIDRYTLEVASTVTDAGSTPIAGLRTIAIGILSGDVNNDGIVNIGDSLGVRARSGSIFTTELAGYDANLDGILNVGDSLYVRARSGRILPGETGQ